MTRRGDDFDDEPDEEGRARVESLLFDDLEPAELLLEELVGLARTALPDDSRDDPEPALEEGRGAGTRTEEEEELDGRSTRGVRIAPLERELLGGESLPDDVEGRSRVVLEPSREELDGRARGVVPELPSSPRSGATTRAPPMLSMILRGTGAERHESSREVSLSVAFSEDESLDGAAGRTIGRDRLLVALSRLTERPRQLWSG